MVRSAQKGFTLIEIMITSALSTMVAFALLALMRMSSDQLQAGTDVLQMNRIYNAVSDEIRRGARVGYAVRVPTDAAVLDLGAITAASPPVLNQTQVQFSDALGNSIGGIRIEAGGVLEEFSGGVWKPMTFGEIAFTVNPDFSKFDVLQGRQGVSYQLRLKSSSNVEIQQITETVLCRNAYR